MYTVNEHGSFPYASTSSDSPTFQVTRKPDPRFVASVLNLIQRVLELEVKVAGARVPQYCPTRFALSLAPSRTYTLHQSVSVHTDRQLHTSSVSVSSHRQTTTHFISQCQFTQTDNYTLHQSVSVHTDRQLHTSSVTMSSRRETTTHFISQCQFTQTDNYTLHQSL